MNSGVIDRFTDVFTHYIDSGFGLLGGEVAFLASTLIVIDLTIAGLFWAWSAEEDLLAHLIKKTLNQTGQQVVRRNLNIQPTITVRPGFPVRVIINRDLVLAPYQG
jgi:hypothetical protein